MGSVEPRSKIILHGLLLIGLLNLPTLFLVKSTYTAEDYERIYINKIVSLYGIPFSFILDRGAKLTSYFWKYFQRGLGTQVKLNTTFHP